MSEPPVTRRVKTRYNLGGHRGLWPMTHRHTAVSESPAKLSEDEAVESIHQFLPYEDKSEIRRELIRVGGIDGEIDLETTQLVANNLLRKRDQLERRRPTPRTNYTQLGGLARGGIDDRRADHNAQHTRKNQGDSPQRTPSEPGPSYSYEDEEQELESDHLQQPTLELHFI